MARYVSAAAPARGPPRALLCALPAPPELGQRVLLRHPLPPASHALLARGQVFKEPPLQPYVLLVMRALGPLQQRLRVFRAVRAECQAL